MEPGDAVAVPPIDFFGSLILSLVLAAIAAVIGVVCTVFAGEATWETVAVAAVLPALFTFTASFLLAIRDQLRHRSDVRAGRVENVESDEYYRGLDDSDSGAAPNPFD